MTDLVTGRQKKKGGIYFFIVLLTIVSIRAWSFQSIPESIYDALELIVIFFLVFFVWVNYKKIKGKKLIFKDNVVLFMLIPVISIFGAFVYHDQPFYLSLLILRTNFYWLFYFLLHIYNVPVKKLIGLMTFVGIVWATLTIVQQFTYPVYYFFTRTDDEETGKSILRAGIYRFQLSRYDFGEFVAIYFFDKFLRTKIFKYLLYVLFVLIGFYYFGTRQFAIALILVIIMTAFMQSGKTKVLAIIFIAIVATFLIFYRDVLFSKFIELTSDQFNDKDGDVRILCAQYFMFEYWPHWTAVFLGNGRAHGISSYGLELKNTATGLGFYLSDIGIIGSFNEFGIFYILNVIAFNIKGLRKRYYLEEDKYLRLFFYYSIIILVLVTSYSNGRSIPFYCFLLYFVDKSYEKKLAQKSVQHWDTSVQEQVS